MDTQRILFLSHYGANPQFMEFFAETAKQSGADVKVILPKEVVYTNGWRPQLFPERKVVDGVEYIPGKLFDKKRYHLSGYLPAIPQTIWQQKPDTVVVTDEVYTLDAFIVIAFKILFWPWRRFQIVTWSQAHYMESAKAVRPLARILLWWNKHFISKFVTRNKKLAARIQAVIPATKKVQVVYWSTNPAQFKPLGLPRTELLQRLGLSEQPELADRKLIGFAGRLVPEKGLLDVIQQLPQLPDTTLLIVGKTDGSHATELQNYVAYHQLAKQVIFLDDKPYGDLVYFYNLIDLFILPTKNHNQYYELFGRVLPEAMMCRTMVLGSTNGAIPEVINNSSGLFAQNDYDQFTTKAKHLLNLPAPERAALLEQNYQYAMANFTVQAFAQNLLTLIKA